jgi:heme exporter protein A
MSLGALEHLQARHLSEGQRRRVTLARLVAGRSALWLLDEVLTSLDEDAGHSVRRLIEDHVSRGGMAVVATHQDLKMATRLSRRIDLAA